MGVEARYVGTFGRDIWKRVDYNQINVPQVFADDFQRARSNGYLALAAKGSFNPAYDSTVTGSMPLTVLTNYGGGSLTNSTVRTYIQQNEVVSLADWYYQARLSSALAAFYPNPGIYQVGAMINDSWQNYNALQIELQRRYRNGFMANFSYTWAHTRSNGGGNGQNRFEPYLDNARPHLDTGRSMWNVNHNLKANLIVDFPFGAGRHWLNNKGRVVNGIVSGWQASSIINWQTGAPLGIYSGRGTFNRGTNRSGFNTATTSLTPEQIQGMMGVYYMPDGRIFYINPFITGPDGRAVAADNLTNTGFAGQLFYNPTAGGIGNLPILAFDAPASLQVDAALSKRFRILKQVQHRVPWRGVQPVQRRLLLCRRHGHQQRDLRPDHECCRAVARGADHGAVRVLGRSKGSRRSGGRRGRHRVGAALVFGAGSDSLAGQPERPRHATEHGLVGQVTTPVASRVESGIRPVPES